MRALGVIFKELRFLAGYAGFSRIYAGGMAGHAVSDGTDCREPCRPYHPRQADQTVLYRVVAENLETFLARARASDRAVPSFVEQELGRFLELCCPRRNGDPGDGARREVSEG